MLAALSRCLLHFERTTPPRVHGLDCMAHQYRLTHDCTCKMLAAVQQVAKLLNARCTIENLLNAASILQADKFGLRSRHSRPTHSFRKRHPLGHISGPCGS